MNSVEERTVRISLKSLWSVVAAVFAFGLYSASVLSGLKEEIRISNSNKEKKDLVQDIQIETNRLKLQQQEMDIRDVQKSLNLKEDKPLK